MPIPTYIGIANVTLGSTAASVTFSSIDQSYKDLVLVITGTKVPLAGVAMQFNDVTTSSYSYVYLYGGTSGVLSSASTTTSLPSAVFTTSNDNVSIINIRDYSYSDRQKGILIRRAANEWGTDIVSGRFISNSAITKIKLYPDSGSFSASSTFALYGIAG